MRYFSILSITLLSLFAVGCETKREKNVTAPESNAINTTAKRESDSEALKRVRAELEKSQSETRELRGLIESANNKIADLESERELAKSQVHHLLNSLAESSIQFDAIKKANHELETKFKRLHQQANTIAAKFGIEIATEQSSDSNQAAPPSNGDKKRNPAEQPKSKNPLGKPKSDDSKDQEPSWPENNAETI